MSKYIKLEDAIYSDCILIDEIMCEGCPFFDGERFLCRMMAWLESLPTYEVSEKVEDEHCKGCKHYKLACDLFSEICKYEPITQTETQNSNLTFEIADTPKAKVSEDCISRADLLKHAYKREGVMSVSVDSIKLAPSAVPRRAEGEWVGFAECSVCGKQAEDFIEGDEHWVMYLPNYCPNCGADMGMKGADNECTLWNIKRYRK